MDIRLLGQRLHIKMVSMSLLSLIVRFLLYFMHDSLSKPTKSQITLCCSCIACVKA